MTDPQPARFKQGDPLHPFARLPQDWAPYLASIRQPPFRGAQLFRWMHANGVIDPALMSNLPKDMRAALSALLLNHDARVSQRHLSADQTIKLAVELRDRKVVETVLIPMSPSETVADPDFPADEDDEGTADDAPSTVRVTQCISTQVGCAMRCAFCASGSAGLVRHLSPEEIVAQVSLGRALLPRDHVLRNVVVMGMGEPLHNYDALVQSLRILTHPDGYGLSTRRVTVSTVGLVPQIQRLGSDFEGKIALAVSLHAADDDTRSRIIPTNRRYPIAALIQSLHAYPLPKRRRITIEYALIDGVNDALSHAKSLRALLKGLRVKINLIPMNGVSHTRLRPASTSAVQAFQQVLIDGGYTCIIRQRRGDDIAAACGQLAAGLQPTD